MPEQSPLTLGLIPPQLRAMAPNHASRKPMTGMQGIAMLESVVGFMRRRVPTLKITVTNGLGSITIHAEVTGPHGSAT